MSLNILINTIKNAAIACNLNFYSGHISNLIAAKIENPALWLAPPIITKVSGLKNGIRNYSLEMLIIDKEYLTNKTPDNEYIESIAHKLCENIAVNQYVKCISDYSIDNNCMNKIIKGNINALIKMNIQIPF